MYASVVRRDHSLQESVELNEIEYERLAEVEDTMWWFQALRKNVLALMERFTSRSSGPILDAGCGTGGVLRAVRSLYDASPLYGIDVFEGAVARTAATTSAHVAVASVNALPFPSAYFKSILSLDVICQRGVEPARALREFHRCLAPGGIVIIQVPAYMWLWGYHDVQCQTAQRFTRPRLQSLLGEHGFEPCFATYWNSALLPLLAVRRKLLPRTRTKSDVAAYPAPLDAIFKAIVSWDCNLIRRGIEVPFGSSVLMVAQKDGAAH